MSIKGIERSSPHPDVRISSERTLEPPRLKISVAKSSSASLSIFVILSFLLVEDDYYTDYYIMF